MTTCVNCIIIFSFFLTGISTLKTYQFVDLSRTNIKSINFWNFPCFLPKLRGDINSMDPIILKAAFLSEVGLYRGC